MYLGLSDFPILNFIPMEVSIMSAFTQSSEAFTTAGGEDFLCHSRPFLCGVLFNNNCWIPQTVET